MRLAIAAPPPKRTQAFQDDVLAVQAGRWRPHFPAHQVDHEAVAQPARRDLHLFDAQLAHDTVEDGRAGVHDVDARFVHAQLSPLLRRRIPQLVEHLVHLLVRDRPAASRRSRETAHELRDRARRSRRADQAAVPADEERIDLREAVLDRFVEEARFLAPDGIALDEELGEAHRAERQAPGALRLLAARGDHLGRATPDVEE